VIRSLVERIRGRLWPTYFLHRRLMQLRLAPHGEKMAGRLLDVGAGDAPYADLFPGATCYVGTNAPRFYAAGASSAVRGATAVWLQDATRLPFRSESFDGVLCFQVLSVVTDPHAFLSEVHRILRPGGILLLTTDFLFPQWSDRDLMRHTGPHLQALADRNGFEVVALESFGGYWTTLHGLITHRLRLLLDGPAASPGRRVARWFWLPIVLPALRLGGELFYRLERHTRDDHTFAMNHLLVARKAAGA
jgi:SAM-dependent methyltransferase